MYTEHSTMCNSMQNEKKTEKNTCEFTLLPVFKVLAILMLYFAQRDATQCDTKPKYMSFTFPVYLQ